MADLVSQLITELMTAISNCVLYSPAHETVDHYCKLAAGTVKPLCGEEPEVSVTVMGKSLFVGNEKYMGKGAHIDAFMKRLRRKGIERLVLKQDIPASEIKDFVVGLSASDEVPKSSGGVQVGVVEVKVASGAGAGAEGPFAEEIQKVKEINEDFAKFGQLDMVGIEDVVASFIATMRDEANVLKLLAPVKKWSEYTFTHTSNVGVLAVFQAQSLGVKGEALHEVGVAGLLHDVGKQFVPKEILEKPGKLDAGEWDIMKKHTTYGARYLATLQDIPRIAVLAAFEHHMRFDGKGYPDTIRRSRQQHIVSQIVSVADFFDALRTDRPYRKAMEVPKVIGILNEGVGAEFNPVLVENLIRTLIEVGAYKVEDSGGGELPKAG